MAKKITLFTIVSSVIIYLVLKTLGFQDISYIVRALLLPLVTLMCYQRSLHKKRSYFFMFLIVFSISEIINTTIYFIPDSNFQYYDTAAYIIALFCLIRELFSEIKWGDLFKRFYIYFVFLSIMSSIYLYYFSSVLSYNMTPLEFYLILFKNALLTFIVCLTLINYCYVLNNKTLFLFIGMTGLLFSEVFKIVYVTITDAFLYNLVSSLLLIIAFYFLLKERKKEEVRFKFIESMHL